MRILHTSDWHLGRLLYGKKRYDEFAQFLDWLINTIDKDRVDLLIIAGDIFDTTTPSNRAQELYYSFLGRVAATGCRHIVVIAGNHDSPSFLDAPRALLAALRVHVVGSAGREAADEILVIDERTADGRRLAAVVCAVPYLRESEIRTITAGESIDDKTAAMLDGIKRHYDAVHAAAEEKRTELLARHAADGVAFVPVITTGHLFTAGGRTIDGDGVRELHVGTLLQCDGSLFDERIDYLALGHLHVPQAVGKNPARRYSGSPVAMGFGEASERKSVAVVDLKRTGPEVALREVPVFRELVRVRGDLDEITAKIETCKAAHPRAWLEIWFEGTEGAAQLQEHLDALVNDTALEIVIVRNSRVVAGVLAGKSFEETMADITPEEVFARCLTANGVPDSGREELTASYREILRTLDEEDSRAE